MSENSQRWRARHILQLKQKKEEKEIDKSFPKFQKVFKCGVRFQLDSKTIINSASKLKAVKRNTNAS